MAEYFLTIFTPTYNRAHTLRRVFGSIRSQTLQMIDDRYLFEWIIVDDGSDDGTAELVQKWQKEVGFEIRYYYQENRGKPAASRKGIELARGEWFLFCDSDDAFLPETVETFFEIWNGFDERDRERCGGIGVLCQDQFGNRIGGDYPIECRMLPTMDTVFGWKDKGLGETWALLKTQNLKRFFIIPDEAKDLKFIPESFFWSRMTIEGRSYSYFLNRVLRVYYVGEGGNISQNVRTKYPEGFFFESKWFVTKYRQILFKYPKVYFGHLAKFVYFSLKR